MSRLAHTEFCRGFAGLIEFHDGQLARHCQKVNDDLFESRSGAVSMSPVCMPFADLHLAISEAVWAGWSERAAPRCRALHVGQRLTAPEIVHLFLTPRRGFNDKIRGPPGSQSFGATALRCCKLQHYPDTLKALESCTWRSAALAANVSADPRDGAGHGPAVGAVAAGRVVVLSGNPRFLIRSPLIHGIPSFGSCVTHPLPKTGFWYLVYPLG